jgi:hypothetical protein
MLTIQIETNEFLQLVSTSSQSAIPRLGDVTSRNIFHTFKMVNVSGKARIMRWGRSTFSHSVHVPEFLAEEDFHRLLANKLVEVPDPKRPGETKRIPLSRWWLTKKSRVTYDGLIFDADAGDDTDAINLWNGFGVEAKKGDWSYMRGHIEEVLADGDEKSADYMIRWIAWGFLNPTKAAEAAMVLMSEAEGTGKGMLGRALATIYGAHGIQIMRREHLIGKFNGHLGMMGLAFLDVATWGGFKEDEGVLKSLITEPTVQIEKKGLDAVRLPNPVKIIMATNADWSVPASAGDRRYAAFRVSDKYTKNTRYFQRISAEQSAGGLGAMLFELRNMDLGNWHPRDNIPQTEALASQKVLSLKPEMKWLAGLLESGTLSRQHLSYPNRVIHQAAFYNDARQSNVGLRHWTDMQFSDFLKKWGAVPKRSNGAYRDFPPLAEMRAKWLKAYPWYPAFGATHSEWTTDANDSKDDGDMDFG